RLICARYRPPTVRIEGCPAIVTIRVVEIHDRSRNIQVSAVKVDCPERERKVYRGRIGWDPVPTVELDCPRRVGFDIHVERGRIERSLDDLVRLAVVVIGRIMIVKRVNRSELAIVAELGDSSRWIEENHLWPPR